ISISKLIRIRYKLYILAILKGKNLSSLSMSVFWDWSIAYMDCMALTLICLLVNILKELTLTGKIYLMRCKNNIILRKRIVFICYLCFYTKPKSSAVFNERVKIFKPVL